MKILVIGANGSVGRPAVEALKDRHEIITVGRSNGDILADMEDLGSIRAMYESIGKVDAVITAIGHGHFGNVAEMTGEQWMKGINHKALPQVNAVLEGISYMSDNGSFTMTSGVLNRDPIAGGACAAAANGAIDSFVLGAAVDMPRGIRINSVSPGVLQNSMDRYDGLFPGQAPVSSERVGLAYVKCVEGVVNGQTVKID